jgi:LuxR family transcriptional regulator, maltose regulon positive regulatory protein
VRCFDASWPPYRAEALADLAELRRRQGRLGEAGDLLDEAAGTPRAALVRARCALDLGQGTEAVASAERYLRRFPESSALLRVEGLEILVRAAVAAGQTARAEAALAELERIARRVATPPLLAMACAAGAALAAAIGRTEAARAGLEDAIDLYARTGMAFDVAAARVDLAELLAALDTPEAARAEAASALAILEEMGATHLARRAAALEARIARSQRNGAPDAAHEALTPRQTEVLRHVAAGLTNREIAAELSLSEKTVDRHLSNAFDRLGVSSRAAAAALAVERGVI